MATSRHISLKDAARSEDIESMLKKNNIPFVNISSFSNEAFIVKLTQGEEVIFSLRKSLDLQISSLQLILSRLTIEGKRFSRLDLRFDKPVVTLR